MSDPLDDRSKTRGEKLHLAFICVDHDKRLFTVAKVRAWTEEDAWILAMQHMEGVGWVNNEPIGYLGHVV